MKKLLTVVTFLLLSFEVLAEVSDKIPSVPAMWAQAILIGCAAFYLASKRWWLSLFGVVMFWALFEGTQDMERDRFLGEAVLQEQGYSYFINGYASAVLLLALTLLGVLYGYVRRRKNGT